jgi:hypothetical protein
VEKARGEEDAASERLAQREGASHLLMAPLVDEVMGVIFALPVQEKLVQLHREDPEEEAKDAEQHSHQDFRRC